MAEVLGLVASGISVAQAAGSIVTTSLKVKALLEEIKDAPETLEHMLDHIELLTPILCEATAGDDGVAGTSPPPLPAASHLQQALQKTLAACQTAGEQLEHLATDLMSQINVARGGVRRKRAIVKVVLKKGTLARYEARLQKTIQILTLAQNTYIIALQRAQPETIVSQLMSALSSQPPGPLSALESSKILTDQTLLRSDSPYTATKSRISVGDNSSSLHEWLHLGFATVTGLVRVQTPSKEKTHRRISSEQTSVLRVKVQMPTWLCASVLDAVFSRSYAGWTCSVKMYGHILHGSIEHGLVRDAIRNDDVGKIHRLFQERRCSPMDRVIWSDATHDESLMTYAMSVDSWQISGYLLNYGAEQDNVSPSLWPRLANEERKPYLENFLKRNELSDRARVSCLVPYCEDIDSFSGLVSRIWPHDEFYTADLEVQRLDLAMVLVSNNTSDSWGPDSPPPAIFQRLCASLSLPQAGKSTTTRILSHLTIGLSNAAWQSPDCARKWYLTILDTAVCLPKAFLMPGEQILETKNFSFAQLFPTANPFANSFFTSMHALPGRNSDPKMARKHKIASRLAKCEEAVQMWLRILQECDIDLEEYGRQERQRLKDQENGYDFRIFRDVWFETPSVDTSAGLFKIRLISFEYGSQPGDWKLWWSEPTDELVGDFWREMDPEPLRIPGSWDDDF